MSINIKSNLDNNFWDIYIDGELDVSTADKLKEHLNELVDEKTVDIKIDLYNLDYIDSTGLGVYNRCIKKIKSKWIRKYIY